MNPGIKLLTTDHLTGPYYGLLIKETALSLNSLKFCFKNFTGSLMQVFVHFLCVLSIEVSFLPFPYVDDLLLFPLHIDVSSCRKCLFSSSLAVSIFYFLFILFFQDRVALVALAILELAL